MGKVKIYASPTCIYCKRAKKFLEDRGVEYEEVDTSTKNGHKELTELGLISVPVLIINGETIKGLNEQKIGGALFK